MGLLGRAGLVAVGRLLDLSGVVPAGRVGRSARGEGVLRGGGGIQRPGVPWGELRGAAWPAGSDAEGIVGGGMTPLSRERSPEGGESSQPGNEHHPDGLPPPWGRSPEQG